MSAINYHWQWTLKSSPSKLWALIVKTDENSTGLGRSTPFLHLDPSPGSSGWLFSGIIDEGSVQTDWIHESRLYCHRIYSSGPLTEMSCQITLDHGKKGTAIKYHLNVVPRGIAAVVAAPYLLGVVEHKRLTLLHQTADKALQDKSAKSALSKTSFLTRDKEPIIQEAVEGMLQEGFEKEWVHGLIRLLAHEQAHALLPIRPYYFATRWSAPPRRILELFLAATRAKLLEKHWLITCQQCKRGHAARSSLQELTKELKCLRCNSPIPYTLDENLELVFLPHPDIRRVRTASDPSTIRGRTIFKQHLEPEQLVSYAVTCPSGCYFVYADQCEGKQWDTFTIQGPKQGNLYIEINDKGLKLIHQSDGENNQIQAANRTNTAHEITIEDTEWLQQRITGIAALTCQYFRTHFPYDCPPNDIPLSVIDVTLLMTQIETTSTTERMEGDLQLYNTVRELCRIQEGIVDTSDGAVVKIVGGGHHRLVSQSCQGSAGGAAHQRRPRHV